MPVLLLVPPAELTMARIVAAKLREGGGEVRAFLEEDDYELRDLGVKIAVSRIHDEEVLEAALTNVHTFLPLLPDPFRLAGQDRWENVARMGKAAAVAAARSDIEQMILPIPAITLGSQTPDEIRNAYTSVLHEFRSANKPLAELRCASRVDEGFLEPDPSGDPLSICEPDDLADLLVRVDDREGVSGSWRFASDVVSVRLTIPDDELETLLRGAEDVPNEAGPLFD